MPGGPSLPQFKLFLDCEATPATLAKSLCYPCSFIWSQYCPSHNYTGNYFTSSPVHLSNSQGPISKFQHSQACHAPPPVFSSSDSSYYTLPKRVQITSTFSNPPLSHPHLLWPCQTFHVMFWSWRRSRSGRTGWPPASHSGYWNLLTSTALLRVGLSCLDSCIACTIEQGCLRRLRLRLGILLLGVARSSTFRWRSPFLKQKSGQKLNRTYSHVMPFQAPQL